MKLSINLPRLKSHAAEYEHIPYTGTNGLYVSVRPEEDSIKSILYMASVLGIDVDRNKLHATVIYSKEPCALEAIEKIEAPKNIKGLLVNIDHWVGHDDKTYVVAKLMCPQLNQLNAAFHRAGARSTFLPYQAHITLGKFEDKLSENMQKTIDELNLDLAHYPMEITMHDFQYGDLK